jgi:hypothetical protein
MSCAKNLRAEMSGPMWRHEPGRGVISRGDAFCGVGQRISATNWRDLALTSARPDGLAMARPFATMRVPMMNPDSRVTRG